MPLQKNIIFQKNGIGRKPRFGKKNGILQKSHFGEDYYSDAAAVGTSMGYIKTFVGCLIGIICIFFGYKMKNTTNVYTQQVSLTITDSTANKSTDPNGKQSTFYTITGTAAECGKNTITVYNYPSSLSIGTVITAFIRPNCNGGQDAITSVPNNSKNGTIIIIVGVVIIALALLNLYMVRKYKALAAVEGVGDMLGMITQPFNNR